VTAIDHELFHWLNGVLIHPWLDSLMPFITDTKNLRPVVILVAVVLALRRDRRSRLAALSLLLGLALADLIASQFLKPLVGRERPCHALEGVRLLVGCGGRNGFPSNHAANAAAAAAALGVFFARSLWVTVPVALLVAWSRVYVGVHYPGDVLAGLLVGAFAGTAVALATRRFVRAQVPPLPAVAGRP
jgi:undecaprenyl-diphosphatase